VLFAGFTFNARADLNCWPDGAYLDMFAGSYGGFFGYPADFSDLPVGSRVGPLREVNLRFQCQVTNQTTWFGVGTRAIPGTTRHTATNTWTNPQLEAQGLGYVMWWHLMSAPGQWGPGKSDTDWTVDETPYQYTLTTLYVPGGAGSFELMVPARVMFYKINGNFQDTGGAYIPSNITANLFTFYVARDVTPSVTAGTEYTYTLNLNNFSSTKRACTPHVDQTIQFDYTTAAGLENHPVGAVEASTKLFDLTFNCPYMAYSSIAFRMQPTYGVVDAANGVVGIRSSGPNAYASGIGIQIQARDVIENDTLATNSGDPKDFTADWRTIKPDPNWYSIPAFQYSIDQIHLDPATTDRTKVINFRARYYRLPGALTGGRVESAVIFHIIHN